MGETGGESHRFKVLANDDRDELRSLQELVEAAGHEVVALAVTQEEAGETQSEIALVMGGSQMSVSRRLRRVLGQIGGGLTA